MSTAPQYNHWAHVRSYYDQPADQGSKFMGARLAVYAAYKRNMEGSGHDDFGSVDELGYYARVCFAECPFIVCFREDSQGFVTEVDCNDYEAIWAQYIENIWLEQTSR